MNLKKNIGFVDQLLRALLILDMVVPCLLGFTTGAVACLMISLALILSFSCVTGYCWFYDILNVTTV
jgi:hypothetical protein